MSDYKLEINLKQHTPLIHFQHDQAGATLRATEVKPKLDRFIVEKLGRKETPKDWFLGDTKALNYKLLISATANNDPIPLGPKTDYDIYYGNMGDGPEKKGTLCDIVKLTFICFKPDLMEAIKKYISEFFIATNFGTMQNKGFGSFTVEKSSDPGIVYCDYTNPAEVARVLRDNYKSEKCYSFDGGNTPFKSIKTVYSIMKSGINLRIPEKVNGKIKTVNGKIEFKIVKYQRSLLFLYMHNKYHFSNEKAWMKQNGIAPAVCYDNEDLGKEFRDELTKQDPYYVRALLGVGDHIEFMKEAGRPSQKTTVTIKSEKIDRLESSVFFKVIENDKKNTVYFVGKRINEGIYDKPFVFSGYKENKLRTPPKEKLNEEEDEFIDGFLDFCYHCLKGDYQPADELYKNIRNDGKMISNVFPEAKSIKEVK